MHSESDSQFDMNSVFSFDDNNQTLSQKINSLQMSAKFFSDNP